MFCRPDGFLHQQEEVPLIFQSEDFSTQTGNVCTAMFFICLVSLALSSPAEIIFNYYKYNYNYLLLFVTKLSDTFRKV